MVFEYIFEAFSLNSQWSTIMKKRFVFWREISNPIFFFFSLSSNHQSQILAKLWKRLFLNWIYLIVSSVTWWKGILIEFLSDFCNFVFLHEEISFKNAWNNSEYHLHWKLIWKFWFFSPFHFILSFRTTIFFVVFYFSFFSGVSLPYFIIFQTIKQ